MKTEALLAVPLLSFVLSGSGACWCHPHDGHEHGAPSGEDAVERGAHHENGDPEDGHHDGDHHESGVHRAGPPDAGHGAHDGHGREHVAHVPHAEETPHGGHGHGEGDEDSHDGPHEHPEGDCCCKSLGVVLGTGDVTPTAFDLPGVAPCVFPALLAIAEAPPPGRSKGGATTRAPPPPLPLFLLHASIRC